MVAGLSAAILGLALWMPSDVRHSDATTAMMLGRLVPFSSGSRAERYTLTAGNVTLDVSALVRNRDFRIDSTIGGYAYAMGRSDDTSWRRTPSGTVRIVRSDVQGDDLDRWPRAAFGFYTTGCNAAGETQYRDRTLWILYCRVPGDIAHFYYFASAGGPIEREVTREGSRVVTYDFDDSQNGGRPVHWQVSGAGGGANVTLQSSQVAAVSANDVAIPPSVTTQFVLPDGGTSSIRARLGDYITIPVTVNGRRFEFQLDTGTPEILIDDGVARRLGIQPVLGHAIAHEVRVGDAVASNLPVETVDIFGGAFEGLLGNEFFTGHVVHLDYRASRIELISESQFKPPSDAHEVPMSSDEGMPLVAAGFGGKRAERVVLDSGGPQSLVSAGFLERSGLALSGSDTSVSRYLEGPIWVESGYTSLAFGPYVFEEAPVTIETNVANNLDVPLDGIIGSRVMKNFEWWFDYDHDRLWVRR